MAKSTLVHRFKSGTVEGTVWSTTYNDAPSIYYKIQHQKFDKETKEWKENPFWNKTDILNLGVVLAALNNYLASASEVKEVKEDNSGDDCPF